MVITPEQLAKPGTEHAHQCALFCWAGQSEWRAIFKMLLFAVPNGGDRNRIVAGRLKAEGVTSGVHDVLLLVSRKGYNYLSIEMKKPTQRNVKNGGLSDNQILFGTAVSTTGGGLVKVCYTWEEAKQALEEYLND